MKTYFYMLLIASVSGGIINIFSHGGGFERHLKYIAGLVSVLILIAPVPGLKNTVSGLEYSLPDNMEASGASNNDEVFIETVKHEMFSYMNGIVLEEFSFSLTRADIDIVLEDGSFVIKSVVCYIPTEHKDMTLEVEKWLRKYMEESVEVKLEN